jgi:hypothetical protein
MPTETELFIEHTLLEESGRTPSEIDDYFLAHYGVRGMRWGVRRGGGGSRTASVKDFGRRHKKGLAIAGGAALAGVGLAVYGKKSGNYRKVRQGLRTGYGRAKASGAVARGQIKMKYRESGGAIKSGAGRAGARVKSGAGRAGARVKSGATNAGSRTLYTAKRARNNIGIDIANAGGAVRSGATNAGARTLYTARRARSAVRSGATNAGARTLYTARRARSAVRR